ncbi:MAG: TetR/AcrR family transcriptional regulator [Eggerthellaceae bacterium]|nr:TetR/AcrR family transcriptional regulator [Eggerthellaceae bacterium]
MAKDTKQRILDEALVMFAEQGFDGTSMRELAETLGLGKSALYKHYTSKDDIWNAMISELEARYSQGIGSDDNLPPIPDSCDELIEMSMKMIRFTMRDEKIILTRKLLLMEQFRDERAKKLASEHFLDRLERIFAYVFQGMMEKGLIKEDDPRMLAFAYTAPVSALIMQRDRYPETDRKVMARIRKFVTYFVEEHKV